MARLFGTDGIRGIANTALSCELALKLGAAGAHVLANEVHMPRILIGMDTRKSGDMLASALSAGICSVGGDAAMVGVVPTPALSYLVRLYKADAAVMISASHNSMEYNGIKWFNTMGYKLSDALEDEMEKWINDFAALPHPIGEGVGRITTVRRAHDEYKEFLVEAAQERLDGLFIVLDCANGAASALARDVFTSLGAQVMSYSDEPDGCNINDQCGSTHPERLQRLVFELGADIGLAFDGDADRLIAVDEQGQIVDGDRILGICALDMKKRGKLKQDSLCLTVMSNLGLRSRMREAGIHVEETAVGDRYVLERMMDKGLSLGGEQSGHIIFLDHHRTGDGMFSAVQLLNVLKRSGKRMSRLAAEIPIYPQVLVNVKLVKDAMETAMNDIEFLGEVQAVEAELGKSGRVLVRASGTEPLIRIMLEGKDKVGIYAQAIRIARVLERRFDGKLK